MKYLLLLVCMFAVVATIQATDDRDYDDDMHDLDDHVVAGYYRHPYYYKHDLKAGIIGKKIGAVASKKHYVGHKIAAKKHYFANKLFGHHYYPYSYLHDDDHRDGHHHERMDRRRMDDEMDMDIVEKRDVVVDRGANRNGY